MLDLKQEMEKHDKKWQIHFEDVIHTQMEFMSEMFFDIGDEHDRTRNTDMYLHIIQLQQIKIDSNNNLILLYILLVIIIPFL